MIESRVWPRMETRVRTTYTDLPMNDERRQHARHKIECPVTALTPGRGKKRILGCGQLYDIGDKGARFYLDSPLAEGHRISLEADFQHPDGHVVTIRFRGIVRRVSPGRLYEIAVSFLKGASFIRRKGSREKSKDSPGNRLTTGSNWIN